VSWKIDSWRALPDYGEVAEIQIKMI